MDNNGVVHSIDRFFQRYFFGFDNNGTFCHNIFSGRIIYRPTLKDDILFIELCQLYRVSGYSTGMIVEYFTITMNIYWQ